MERLVPADFVTADFITADVAAGFAFAATLPEVALTFPEEVFWPFAEFAPRFFVVMLLSICYVDCLEPVGGHEFACATFRTAESC
jgi:hypothetical protein